MPFNGTSDPNLPSNVRGLSDKRKRQWISVYDSARARGLDEGAAIKMANGVVKRELGHSTGAAGRRQISAENVTALQSLLPREEFDEALDEFIASQWPDEGESIVQEPVVSEGERSVGFVDQLMDFFRGRRGESETQFSLREMPDGRLRYYTFATNNYKDRGNILFPEAAQRQYQQWVATTGRYPELWQWHARGSRFGQADQLWFDDHFQFTSGLIDAGKEELALRLASRGEEVAMSHGYVGRHVELPDGTIEVPEFIQFEQSVLPRKAAANYGTYFGLASGVREARMRFTDEQRAWFRDVAHESDERINEMERLTNDMQDFFGRHGVDFRSIEGAEGAPPFPATPGTPTPAAPSVAVVGSSGDAGQPGSGGGAATTTPSATGSVGATLTEEEVRRIAGEAVTAALEPMLAEVRSIGAGVRQLSQSDDEKVAGHWSSRAASLPQGFRASQQGPAPAAGAREAVGAGVGSGGANGSGGGTGVDSEWVNKAFSLHPYLGQVAGEGGQ